MNKTMLRAAIGASALALAIFSTAYAAEAGDSPAKAKDAAPLAKLSHSQAASQLSGAGISITSSGGCSDRNKPNCTSLDQVNSATIQGAITLKGASGCALTVTGGTETGHARRHLQPLERLQARLPHDELRDQLRHRTPSPPSVEASGSPARGTSTSDEGNHWDVTFHNCGGCLKGGKG